MAKFICSKCNRVINVPRDESGMPPFIKNRTECMDCYSVIAAGRYEKNIAGTQTLFSPIGALNGQPALGDSIMYLTVLRYYMEQNPNEKVKLAKDLTEFNEERIKSCKIFWADTTGYLEDGMKWFSLPNEARALGKMGIYPQLPEQPAKPKNFNFNDYVVAHVRNIDKCLFKNWTLEEVMDILAFVNLQLKQQIVLVGNDQSFNDEGLFATDLRNKLTLAEIGWVLQHAKLFVGKDSGIAHMAAAAKCKSVVWGFHNEAWVPVNPVPSDYLQLRDSSINNIKEKISEAIKCQAEL